MVVEYVISVAAIAITIVIAYRRSRSTSRQIELLELQVRNQHDELAVMRQLVESFDRLVVSYDTELSSLRTQIQLTSYGNPSESDAVAIEAEREKQKAEKKRQKDEAKLIKKYMKSLEKGS